MVQVGATQRAAGGSWGLREMQRRAVAVESHVDVGTMLQVVSKQVHLPVARRRVERHFRKAAGARRRVRPQRLGLRGWRALALATGLAPSLYLRHASRAARSQNLNRRSRVVARTVAIRDGARERLQAR